MRAVRLKALVGYEFLRQATLAPVHRLQLHAGVVCNSLISKTYVRQASADKRRSRFRSAETCSPSGEALMGAAGGQKCLQVSSVDPGDGSGIAGVSDSRCIERSFRLLRIRQHAATRTAAERIAP